MGRWSRNLSDEIPGYEVSTLRLRNTQTTATSRALIAAAGICMLRAAIVPWIMYYSNPASRSAPTDLEIVTTSILMMCVFTTAAMTVRLAPLMAALICLTVFAGVCTRDALAYPDLMQQGLISKTLIGIMLVRAVMNAIMSRTM